MTDTAIPSVTLTLCDTDGLLYAYVRIDKTGALGESADLRQSETGTEPDSDD